MNHENHFVVGGEVPAICEALKVMDRLGMTYVELPVDFAFHTAAADVLRAPMMTSAAHLTVDLPASGPRVISSATTGQTITVSPHSCWHVVRAPIRFAETLRSLDIDERTLLIDLSPSSTLHAVSRSTFPKARSMPVITPFHAELKALDDIEAALSAVRA